MQKRHLLKYLFWGTLCFLIILFGFLFIHNRNTITLNDITWEFLGGKENLGIIRDHSKIIIGPANIQLWGKYPYLAGDCVFAGKTVKYLYAPSEPHGEEEEGFFRVGIYQKDECRRAMMTARRHFPLHNNEPELIDYFASPLGISKSICPAGVEFKRGRTSSSHFLK